jgi:ribosomal protein S18 acetylase RimI-like enzyme
MMIAREYQRQNHGTFFLKYLENHLFQTYDTIELQSFAKNIIANNFYEKNGWIKAQEIDIDGILFYRYLKKPQNNNF